MSTMNNTNLVSKIKYYTDESIFNTPIQPNTVLSEFDELNWLADGSYEQNSKAIDRPECSTCIKKEKSNNLSSSLLERQFAPALYKTNLSLETDLRQPTYCNRPNNNNINMDNIGGFNTDKINNYSSFIEPIKEVKEDKEDKEVNNLFVNNGLLLSKDEFNTLNDRFSINCSSRRKDLNWGDYRAPARQVAGTGFGNPENYHQVHVGADTRNDNFENPRNIDFQDRGMIPIESFKINYANLPYETDIRNGVSTRTYKKSNSQF